MELNEMIQGVLLRVVSQEEDWKKSVEQLRKDMATKVSGPEPVTNGTRASAKNITHTHPTEEQALGSSSARWLQPGGDAGQTVGEMSVWTQPLPPPIQHERQEWANQQCECRTLLS